MKIKYDLSRVDFRSTPVENLFLDTYLSQASGDAIKVYLYGWKRALMDPGKDLTVDDISKNLAIPLDQVMEAMAYWMDEDLVDLSIEDGEEVYRFKSLLLLWSGSYDQAGVTNGEAGSQPFDQADLELNPSQEEGQPDPTPDLPPSPGLEGKASEFQTMFSGLEDYLSQRQSLEVRLKVNEINLILDLLDRYPIEPDYFLYAYKKADQLEEAGSHSINYVTAIVENWIRFEGATDREKLDQFLADEEKKEGKRKSRRKKAKRKVDHPDQGMTKQERQEWVAQKLKESRKVSLRGDKDNHESE